MLFKPESVQGSGNANAAICVQSLHIFGLLIWWRYLIKLFLGPIASRIPAACVAVSEPLAYNRMLKPYPLTDSPKSTKAIIVNV